MSLNKIGAAIVLMLIFASPANAQLGFHDPATNRGILDQVIVEFSTRAAAWQTVIMNAASWLFWTLGTISFTWTMGMLALKKSDVADFFAEFIRFILFFGFFYWLLRNGPNFADSIIRSLRKIGDSAAGTNGLSPSGVVDVGFIIWNQAIHSLTLWSPVDSAIGVILSAGILILLAVVGVNMLLLLISAWILMYAGIFFLGFGGSRWTSDMAINYFKTVLGIAVQLFTMILIVGIGTDLLTVFYAKMTKGSANFEELGVMLVFCIALLLLVARVPQLLASIITGSGIGSATGIGSFTAGAIAGAAASTAAMASTAGMAGVANIGGGVQALMAAFSKASSAENTGGISKDFLAQSRSGNNGSDTPDPLADAMGDISANQSPPDTNVGSKSGKVQGSSDDHSLSEDAKSLLKENGTSSPGKEDSPASTISSGDSAAKNQGQDENLSPPNLNSNASTGGKVRRIALGTAGNVVDGAWQVSKTAASNLKTSMLQRMENTLGGKIAKAIKASDPNQNTAGNEGNSFANSLSAGNSKNVDAAAEVAAFRDRDQKE